MGCKVNNGFATFTSGNSDKSSLASAGHSAGVLLRKDGPFTQRPFISLTGIPRLISSAGLSAVGTYFQTVDTLVAWIPAILTLTNGLSNHG